MSVSVSAEVSSLLSELVQGGFIGEEEFEFCEERALSTLTTFRTGGPAAVLSPKSQKAFQILLCALRERKIPYFVLGNGSNVIAPDEGYRGVILSTLLWKNLELAGDRIIASSGVSLTALALFAQKNALTGMEFFYGIPGSVGGAVFMNAGAYGGECKSILESVCFLSASGRIETLPVSELEMGYRTSIFEKNEGIILSAVFRLQKGDAAEIRRTMEDLMSRRVEKQPLDYPSAGSTFKRCEGRFTAQMIDEAGLKGARIGGAMVSKKHAGFVINYDSASSEDIFRLIELVRKTIFEKEGIHIQCEVRTIR